MSVTANYGIVFFMPQIVKGIGLTNMMTGVVSSVPYIIGTIGLIAWGWSSDRNKERRWHLIAASTVGALGLAFAGWSGASYWALLGMSAATVGIYGSRAAFWPMPSLFLTGTAAAGAIAHDQCHRQSRRLFRPLRRRLDQGFHAQLRGRTLLPRRLFADGAVITFFAARAAGDPAAIARANAAAAAE